MADGDRSGDRKKAASGVQSGPPGADSREGFWGHGRHGGGFHREDRRDYSREDYGATDRGPGEEHPLGAENIGLEEESDRSGSGGAHIRETGSSTGGRR